MINEFFSVPKPFAKGNISTISPIQYVKILLNCTRCFHGEKFNLITVLQAFVVPSFTSSLAVIWGLTTITTPILTLFKKITPTE